MYPERKSWLWLNLPTTGKNPVGAHVEVPATLRRAYYRRHNRGNARCSVARYIALVETLVDGIYAVIIVMIGLGSTKLRRVEFWLGP